MLCVPSPYGGVTVASGNYQAKADRDLPNHDPAVRGEITVLQIVDGHLPGLLDSVGKRPVSRDGYTGVTIGQGTVWGWRHA